MQIFKFIVHILDSIRFLPHVLVYVLCKNQIVDEDIRIWAKFYKIQMGGVKCFFVLMREYKEFTIGDNSIIGAGTTVTTDIPANSLIVGAKPRILINEYCGTTISETRDEDHL